MFIEVQRAHRLVQAGSRLPLLRVGRDLQDVLQQGGPEIVRRAHLEARACPLETRNAGVIAQADELGLEA